jgi:hypothetical protein
MSENHAGTSRTLPSFQMIIGNPRRRSSARFFRVARRWACEATRASADILFSGIDFKPLCRFFFMEREDGSKLNNTLGVRFKFVSARCRNQHAGSMRSPLMRQLMDRAGIIREQSHRRSRTSHADARKKFFREGCFTSAVAAGDEVDGGGRHRLSFLRKKGRSVRALVVKTGPHECTRLRKQFFSLAANARETHQQIEHTVIVIGAEHSSQRRPSSDGTVHSHKRDFGRAV